MLLDDFRTKLAAISEDTELDELCMAWIEGALRDNGKEGQVGMALLNVIRKHLMP